MIEKQSIAATHDIVLIGVHFTEYALLYPFYKLLVKALPVIITRPYQKPAASFRYSRLGHLSRIAQKVLARHLPMSTVWEAVPYFPLMECITDADMCLLGTSMLRDRLLIAINISRETYAGRGSDRSLLLSW